MSSHNQFTKAWSLIRAGSADGVAWLMEFRMYEAGAGAAQASADARDAGEAARYLVSGGDERIATDGDGRNRYGCGGCPNDDVEEFSSSTASTISASAFAAVSDRMNELLACGSAREAYDTGAAEIRHRIAAACGLPTPGAERVVLSPSGTDLHRIVAALCRGTGARRVICVIPDPTETGRGVPEALRDGLQADPAQLRTIRLREEDGRCREPGAVDADVEAKVRDAVAAGADVLLVVADTTKTGLVAPTPECALRLKERHGDGLTILVDACQLRLSPDTLRAYLAAGFLIAITGSKFLGGPAFSGALLLPEGSLGRLQAMDLQPVAHGGSARGDWPSGFAARDQLADTPNLGLLLRWQAALHEWDAFRAVPAEAVEATLRLVSRMVKDRLTAAPFEAVTAPTVARFGEPGWDALPSIFPFLVVRRGEQLDSAATQALYERLREGRDMPPGLARRRLVLGQPVQVGRREGQPVMALRLAISARQIVKAARHPAGAAQLAQSADQALARVALAVEDLF